MGVSASDGRTDSACRKVSRSEYASKNLEGGKRVEYIEEDCNTALGKLTSRIANG